MCSFLSSFARSCDRCVVRTLGWLNLLYFSLQGSPHKLAVIFVDNSGVDIILGMFPFVRELLSRGTKVQIVCYLIHVSEQVDRS